MVRYRSIIERRCLSKFNVTKALRRFRGKIKVSNLRKVNLKVVFFRYLKYYFSFINFSTSKGFRHLKKFYGSQFIRTITLFRFRVVFSSILKKKNFFLYYIKNWKFKLRSYFVFPKVNMRVINTSLIYSKTNVLSGTFLLKYKYLNLEKYLNFALFLNSSFSIKSLIILPILRKFRN